MSYRPFILFHADGDSVTVVVETMLNVERHLYRVPINCGSQIAAALLARHLTQVRNEIVSDLVEKAYANGYRDGRGKRSRRAFHNVFLGRDVP